MHADVGGDQWHVYLLLIAVEYAEQVHDGGGGGEIHIIYCQHEVVALVHHVVADAQRERKHAGRDALAACGAGQSVNLVGILPVFFQQLLYLLLIRKLGGEAVLLVAAQIVYVDAQVQSGEVVDGVGCAADGKSLYHLVVLVYPYGVHPHFQPAFPFVERLPYNVALAGVCGVLFAEFGLLKNQWELPDFEPCLVFYQILHVRGGGLPLLALQRIGMALVEGVQFGGIMLLVHQFEGGVLGASLVHHQVFFGAGHAYVDVGHILLPDFERILEKAVLAFGLEQVGVEEQGVLDGLFAGLPLGQLGNQQVVPDGVQCRYVLGALP